VLEVFFKFSVDAHERIGAQPVSLGVGGVLQVLGGCARAHLPDVAPELVSELETHSRVFVCNCRHCSLGGFVGAVTAVMSTWAQ
jgi:ABC-type phosphate/phosphonate transport system permease subunit